MGVGFLCFLFVFRLTRACLFLLGIVFSWEVGFGGGGSVWIFSVDGGGWW